MPSLQPYTGPWPEPWDRETNPPPIVGLGTEWQFSPEESFQYYNPPPPSGWESWTEYVKAAAEEQKRGGSTPDAEGATPMSTILNIGWDRVASQVDPNDPEIRSYLENIASASRGYDQTNIFHDPFFHAVMGLGAIGGAYALAGYGPGSVVGGAAAGGEAAAGGAGAGITEALADVSAAEAANMGAGAGAWGGLGGVTPETMAALEAAGVSPSVVGGNVGPAGASSLANLATIAKLGGTGLSAISSILGAGMGANASRGAAETLGEGATNANKLLADIYNQIRSDYEPYRQAGYAALANLAGLAQQPMSPGPYTAYTPMNPGGYTFDPAAYGFTAPNQALNPADYPALNPADYQFTPISGQQVLNDDPGYAFRVAEGMKALQNTQAARGGLLSGGAMKAAQRFGQQLGSQEYGAAYNRALGRNQMDWQRAQYGNETDWQRAQYGNEQAYNRAVMENQLGYERGLTGNQLRFGRDYQYNQDIANRQLQEYQTNLQAGLLGRQQTWNELAQLAGYGQAGVGGTANAANMFGQQSAENITGAASAAAAGDVGAANAWARGLTGAGNAASAFLGSTYFSDLLKLMGG